MNPKLHLGKYWLYIPLVAMAIFYLLGGIVLLVMHAERIPGAFAMVFDGAFNGTAATGGGAVKATVTGAMRLTALEIDPAMFSALARASR